MGWGEGRLNLCSMQTKNVSANCKNTTRSFFVMFVNRCGFPVPQNSYDITRSFAYNVFTNLFDVVVYARAECLDFER